MKTQNLIILGLIVLVAIAVGFFILSQNQTSQGDNTGKESGILKNITVNKTQNTEENTEQNTTNQENCTEKGSCGNQTQTQTCSDGTPYSQCSENKPKYCSSGNLIDDCSKCGCQNGYTCNTTTKSCSPLPQLQTCSDGTPYSQCSSNKPKYCSNGNLADDCVSCGCSNGYACNTTTKSCYTTAQTCSDGTPYSQCSLTKPKYCSNGNLIDNCGLCSCPSGQQCNSTNSQCKITNARASVNYNWNGTHLTVNIASREVVGSAAIFVNILSNLTVGSASLTGFMAGATYMQEENEHAWFQLDANGNSGSITIPITCSSPIGSYEIKLAGVVIKNSSDENIVIDTAMPVSWTIRCNPPQAKL